MTYQPDCTLPEEMLEQIADGGLAALPDAFRLLLNAAMLLERQKFIGVGPYQRSPERQAHANGFKPKTLQTRIGAIPVAVPQGREGGFYPHSLDKGTRSERALKLALAEMYVQGVSTRKVAAITEQLCGFTQRVPGQFHPGQPRGGRTGCGACGMAHTTPGGISLCGFGCTLRKGAPGRPGA